MNTSYKLKRLIILFLKFQLIRLWALFDRRISTHIAIDIKVDKMIKELDQLFPNKKKSM